MNCLFHTANKTAFIQVSRKGNLILCMRLSIGNAFPDRIAVKSEDIINGTYFTEYQSGDDVDELFIDLQKEAKKNL